MKRLRGIVLIALLSCSGVTPPSGRQVTGTSTFATLRPLAECDPAPPGAVGPADVSIVIDASASTSGPSGLDVDLDGTQGQQPRNRIFPESSDSSDSVLAAQVASAKLLVDHYRGTGPRFSVVAYSGTNPRDPGRRASSFFIASGLSTDPAALGAALDRVEAYGSRGGKVFSAGMFAAMETLTDGGNSPSGSRRLVLFISDSAQPIVLENEGASRADPPMKDAAQQAINRGIKFHTFGLPDPVYPPGVPGAASAPLPHALSQIAGATGGTYHAVPDFRELGCALASSLSPQ